MKKFRLPMLFVMLLCALFLSACGGAEEEAEAETKTENKVDSSETKTENKVNGAAETTADDDIVSSIENMDVEAICVDDSYRDDDDSPLRTVYLFYTFNAGDENLKIDSVYTHLKIGDKNEYESEFLPADSALKYMYSYYYGGYIEDVYTGTSLKVAATFLIPENDLTEGKTITLTDTQIPGVEEIRLSTDMIQHFNSGEEIAEAIDPEGYAAALNAYSDADNETVNRVKNAVNGRYWQFYVNSIAYNLEFWADNNFELKTKYSDASGTYSVKNGYIILTYPNGNSVELPYTFEEDGSIDLDTIAAFDVKKMPR